MGKSPALIVILGARVLPDGRPSGTLKRRVESALACARERRDCLFIPSGGVGEAQTPEWVAMRELLRQAGVAEEAIAPETEGVDTLSQVRLCLPIIARLRAGREIYVATSRYHQLRAWLLFRRYGVAVRLAPAIADRPAVPWRKLVWFWLREFAAVPYDLAISLLSARAGPSVSLTPTKETNP